MHASVFLTIKFLPSRHVILVSGCPGALLLRRGGILLTSILSVEFFKLSKSLPEGQVLFFVSA